MMLEICKYMHWDYWTYQEQPQYFIDIISLRISNESLAIKMLNKKNGRK